MRAALAAVLLIIATLLAPFVIGAMWLDGRIDDTDAFVRAVGPLGEDPDLRKELADEVSVAAVAAVQQYVPIGLPGAFEDRVRDAAEAVVRSDGFPEFWREATRKVHREFLRLVRNGADGDDDQWVEVDLTPLLDDALKQLSEFGIPVSLLPEIPLQVPLVKEATLLESQGRYQAMSTVNAIGPFVLLILIGSAVAVAPGWRSRLRTLGFAGIGLALGALLAIVANGPVTDLLADRAEAGRSGLVRLIVDVVLESFPSYAAPILAAAPIGAVLVVVSLLGRRRAKAPQAW